MQPGDKLIFSTMVWTERAPHLRLRRNGGRSEFVAVRGLRLRYALTSESNRRCIGHKPFRDPSTPWIDCDSAPLPQSRTCDRCSAVDATFAAQLHHAHTLGAGEIDATIRTHLDKPNVLYLAAFRDGSIKVGTSTAPRLETRLREQGAWAARIVAKATNGFAVRTLEDAVTAELGLSQAVAIGRKLAGFADPKAEASLDRELTSWVFGVHRIVRELNDDRLNTADTAWDNPLRHAREWDDVHRYPLRLNSGAHDVEMHDACGRAIRFVRATSTDAFVADIGQLFGYELHLVAHVEPDEVTVQDSLF